VFPFSLSLTLPADVYLICAVVVNAHRQTSAVACVRVHALWRRVPSGEWREWEDESYVCLSLAELNWLKWGFADWQGRGRTWQSAFCGWLDALRKKWVGQVCGSSLLSLLFVCGLFWLVKMFTAMILVCTIVHYLEYM